MNKFNTLSIINSILLLITLTIGVFFYIDSRKEQSNGIGYVDNAILFNEFNMTKDIKAIEEKKMISIKKSLDSLFLQYQNIENKNNEKARILEKQLSSKSETLKNIQSNYTTNLSQKVWSRLNEYVGEYAKNKKIEIIFGTNGNGNIMFAKEYKNLTDSVLRFSNKKYEGY